MAEQWFRKSQVAGSMPAVGSMIERGHGNIFDVDVDALVNPVNTVGVMGKGLALQIKKAFPQVFHSYRRAYAAQVLAIGTMHVVDRAVRVRDPRPRWIINFPTKRHWQDRSQLRFIELGLIDLVRVVADRAICSLTVPALGCGNGGLRWGDVRPLIVKAFDALPDVRVVLFEPGDVL